jgi:hypothetical protein
VVFIADELDAKTEHLGNALGVAGMMVMQDVDLKLADIVDGSVKNETIGSMDQIVTGPRLN